MDKLLQSIVKQETLKDEYFDRNQSKLNVDVKVEIKSELDDDDWNVDNYKWIVENRREETEDLNLLCLQKCSICREIFANRYELLRHNLTHLSIQLVTSLPAYQCDLCSQYFVKKTSLIIHINNHNRNNKNMSYEKCKLCKKVYSYKYMSVHVNAVHGTKNKKCDICGMTFTCKRYLIKHIMKHNCFRKNNVINNRSLKFQCKQCPKIFKSQINLTCHIKNCHSQPAECHICHSILKSRTYLNTHMNRVHYNDGKIHKCKLCFKEFKSPRCVSIHMKNSHVGVKLKCEFCGTRYWGSLKKHLMVCKQKQSKVNE